MKANSASRWVYSLKWRRVWLATTYTYQDFGQRQHPQRDCSPVLGAEALLDTEHIPETWQTCLQIKLRALGEERRLAVIIQLEKCGAAFNLGLDQAWGRDLEHAMRIEALSERGEHGGAETEDTRRIFAS